MSQSDSKPSLLTRWVRPSLGSSRPSPDEPPLSSPSPSSTICENPLWKRNHFSNYIWLIYSFFFVIVPWQQNNLRDWLAFACAYSCFLAIYIGIHTLRSAKHQLGLIGALFLLACSYMPLNPGAAGMFIYVAAFAPFISESIPLSIALIAASAGGSALEGWLLHQNASAWGLCAIFSLAAGVVNISVAQRVRAGWKLGLAHEQIEHLAKVAERERIARDLHDVLGHTLSVVVLKAELAGKLMDRDPVRARLEIGEVEHIARKALTEVREAIRGYRAEGLAAEIARARKTLDSAGVTLEFGDTPPHLPPAEETVISLIVREAVTNIVRHAHASRCRLAFQETGNGAVLVVEDDGRGGIRSEGNGLRGMRERVESLGGRLHIDSVQGTRLVVQLPAQAAIKA